MPPPFDVAQLKAAIAGMGGVLDINRLDAKYAFYLMTHGLILQEEQPSNSKALPELVLNPIWADFVKTSSTATSAESPNESTGSAPQPTADGDRDRQE